MKSLIYYGEQLTEETNGWFRPFTDAETLEGLTWADFQVVLCTGEHVYTRGATQAEYEFASAGCAAYLKSGPSVFVSTVTGAAN